MLNTLSNMAQHVAVSGDMGGMGGMGYGMGGMRHMAALATPRTTDGSTTPRSGATRPPRYSGASITRTRAASTAWAARARTR